MSTSARRGLAAPTCERGRAAATVLACACLAGLGALLAHNPEHTSRIARRRRVRLVELHTELSSDDTARAVARVLDAHTAFTIALTLRRGPRVWEVTGVS